MNGAGHHRNLQDSFEDKGMDCSSLKEVPNLTPIIGSPGYFRIRMGDYRVGISLEGSTVWFLFFGKRDDQLIKNSRKKLMGARN